MLALVLIALVVGAYIGQFYFRLGLVLSDNASDWVNFSGFVGGILAPILSFLSFVLLLKSLNLQNKANTELRKEAELNRKKEKFSSFETHFFSMLDAQRVAFDNFKIQLTPEGKTGEFRGVEGVINLEDIIEDMRKAAVSDSLITEKLLEIDSSEKIYNTIRIFYNVTKIIGEKLSDEEGFSAEERMSQFQTLINFTEFSLLRLVLISMQFVDCPPTRYLKNNEEFITVMVELGLEIDPY